MLSVLLALLPLAYLIRMCIVHHVDVPFWDQWAMVPRLEHMAAGRLTFTDFWGQHNEHRPLVPVATMLVLAKLSNWNIGWEIGANVAIGAAIFAVFSAYIFTAWRDRGGAPILLLPVISLLVFSPVQWENWVWGWQIQVLMCALASITGAYLIASGTRRRGGFAGALACGVWATYSFASGLVYWAAQPPGIWMAGGGRRVARLLVWIAVAAVTAATYFYDFHRPSQPSMLSNFASLAAIRQFAMYLLTYLGAPIEWTSQRGAAAAGGAIAVVYAALVIRLWHLRGEKAFLFPFLVGLQTFATATVSALGRAWMGVDQALTSRYTTFTLPLWCAVACLLVLWQSTSRPGALAHARTLVVASVIAATLWASFISGRYAVVTVAGRNETLMLARRGLITGWSDTMLLQLFPNLDTIREQRATLMRLHLSVFRPTSYATYPMPGAK